MADNSGWQDLQVPRAMQLDLFNDSEPARLERELVGALCAWDGVRARELLARLLETAEPGPRLRTLADLVQDIVALDGADASPEGMLECLERRLLSASRVLGGRAPEFQVAAWRRLARALQGSSFDAAKPRQHASYAALQAGDWEQLRSAVEAQPDWREQPVLLGRRLRAAHGLGDDLLAAELLCRLCWEFPGAAGLLRDDPRFGPWFRDFQALDTELRPPAFPAWYALCPGRRLPLPEGGGDGEGREMLAAVHGVLEEAPGEPNVAARRRLQRASPELCRMYLARRDVRGE